MVFFIEQGDKHRIGYLKSGRNLRTLVRKGQEWSPEPLGIVAELTECGEAIKDEILAYFREFGDRGGWVSASDTLDVVVAWARTHPSASPAEVRAQLRKCEGLFPKDAVSAKGIANKRLRKELSAGAVRQTHMLAKVAKRDLLHPCPICNDEITVGEDFLEIEAYDYGLVHVACGVHRKDIVKEEDD